MKIFCLALAATLASMSAAEARNSANDQSFVTKAAQGGMTEVELGDIAAAQGKSSAVKTFGKQMSSDHTKAGDALKKAAATDGLTVPTDASAQQQKTIGKMKAMSGDGFDKAYTAAMIKDHKDTIALFEKEAKSGKSPAVKAFAETTLPTLKSHMTMANALAAGGK